MKKKYFLKGQSSLQRKIVAGSLAATFCVGALGSYTSAMNPELNILNQNDSEEKNYTIKSGDIATLTDEEGKVWGYNKESDKELLKLINGKDYVRGVVYNAQKNGLHWCFGSISEEFFKKIQEKFKVKFNKDLDVKNVIFALFKSGNANDVDCSSGLQFLINNFTKEKLLNALKIVFGIEIEGKLSKSTEIGSNEILIKEENIRENSEEDEWLIKGENLVSVKIGDSIFGYDKSSQEDVKILKTINKKGFSNSFSQNYDTSYDRDIKPFVKAFSKNFKKQLKFEDILFLCCKNHGSAEWIGDNMESFIVSNLLSRENLEKIFSTVFSKEDLEDINFVKTDEEMIEEMDADMKSEEESTHSSIQEKSKNKYISKKVVVLIIFIVSIIFMGLIAVLIICLATSSNSKKIETTTKNKETAGPESNKEKENAKNQPGENKQEKSNENLEQKQSFGVSSTAKKVCKTVAVSLLGASGGLGAKYVGEKTSNSDKSSEVKTKGSKGKEKSKLVCK